MLEKQNRKTFLVMTAIFIATFMTSVETTIVTTALPTIISELNGLSLQSWVFSMYLLTTAVSTPIYGKLSDQIGRKPIFIIGLIVFSTGSLLCGLADNIYFLILFRAIQGIGAGAIMPITFTIIADLFSYEQRSKMLALNNTAWGISALMGPLLGGFIVDRLNWHWIFFINVPLGVIVLILILFGLREKKHESQKETVDFKGIIGLAGTLIALLMLLQVLGSAKLNPLVVGLLTVIFLGFLVGFIKVESQINDPLIPLKLFKNSLFTVEILTATLLSGMQVGFQNYFPIWLQSIYKVPATVAGLAITPSPIMWLVTSFFVGGLVKRFSPKKITLPIVLIQMLFYVPLVFAKITFPMFMFYLVAGVCGAGLGIVITMNILVSQQIVNQKDVGTASSILVLGRTLGQTIMTGILGLTFNLAIARNLTNFKNIDLAQINHFISSGQTVNITKSVGREIRLIVLSGMHAIFMVVILLFVIVFFINAFNKDNQVVK